MSDVITIRPSEAHDIDAQGKEIIRAAGFRDDMMTDLHPAWPESQQIMTYVTSVGAHVGSERDLASSLLVDRDGQQVVVSDPLGAAYGCGGTLGEAVADWEEAARETLVELEQARDHLHPRLVRQLVHLRRIFG